MNDPRLVAFLRAINVGGHTVKNDRLRELFTAMGLTDVATFIASGNVVFAPADNASPAELETTIATRLEAELGFPVVTFARPISDLARLEATLVPGEPADDDLTYVGFLHDPPEASVVSAIEALDSTVDTVRVVGRDILWRRSRSGESTVTAALLERALAGQPTTVRNMNTIRRMAKKFLAG